MRFVRLQLIHCFGLIHAGLTVALVAVFGLGLFENSGISLMSLLRGVELFFPLVGPLLAANLILQEKDLGFLSFTMASKAGIAKVWLIRFCLVGGYILLNLSIYSLHIAAQTSRFDFPELFLIGAAPALFFTALCSFAGILTGSSATGTAIATAGWAVALTLSALAGGLHPVLRYVMPFPAFAGGSTQTIVVNKIVFLGMTFLLVIATWIALSCSRIRERLLA